MSDIVIRTENLGKRYRIGERERYVALRDVLTRAIYAPARIFRRRREALSPNGDPTHIWALKHVCFEVRQGEVVGIIGRNGAGKTTLLKILARVTMPTEGHAKLQGRVGSLLEVGTGFHPELTGRENVYLSGAILGMGKKEIQRKFDEIVAFAEVEKFIDTPLKHYSSGMAMRLAFAVAAHLEPEILLVDEVLAVGDAAFQKKCLGKMGQVSREGRTVLFVSHNMSAVVNLCSRAYLLEQGSAVAEGPPPLVLQRYLESLGAPTAEDLTTLTARDGQGRVRFSRVWLEDDEGRLIDSAGSGQTVILAVEYASQQRETLPNCRASIAVEDMLGQPMFVCSTEMVCKEPVSLFPKGIIRCVIPCLPLSQGTYRLTLFLEANKITQDYLPSVASLTVVDADFFGSGRQYPEGWMGKCVLVPHSWSFSSNDQINRKSPEELPAATEDSRSRVG